MNDTMIEQTTEAPAMHAPLPVAADTTSLPSYVPVPGHGILPVNAFVVRGREPVLVDTGLAALREPFMAALRATIAPEDIRWIWLSHMDPDHIGNLAAVLDEAVNARVVTNFLGMGKLMLHGFAPDRVHMVEPGMRLELGDRALTALRPAYYDAPESMGFHDDKTGVLFSVDCFGALMREPAEDAAAITPDALREGLVTWPSIDAPWLAMADGARLARALSDVERLSPSVLLSGHLPPATGLTSTLVRHLTAAHCAR